MARYRVKEVSFINGAIVEAGEEVEYEGVASHNLEPIGAEKAVDKAEADAKAALVKEAIDLKATIVGEDGKPTSEPITGDEDLETIQHAIQQAKERRTD